MLALRGSGKGDPGKSMGGCQNYGPFLDPYYHTTPNIRVPQKRIIILTTTHIGFLRSPLLCTPDPKTLPLIPKPKP